MEPFRLMVDAIARRLAREENEGTLSPEQKRLIASVLQQDLMTEKGASPVVNCLARLAQSLAVSLAEKRDALALAEIHRPGRLL